MTSSIDSTARSAWPAPWRHGDRDNFFKARELTLNLVQWPARIANSYVAKNSAEDRLALDFHRDGSMVTRSFDHEIALGLRLPALELQFQECGTRVPHILDPEEHSPAEVEAWILVELLHRGVDRDKFSKSLPYTIPNLLSGDAEDYSPAACGDGLALLTAWYCSAASTISSHGRVVCLPQTLTLVAVPGDGRPTVGFSRVMPSAMSLISSPPMVTRKNACCQRLSWRMKRIRQMRRRSSSRRRQGLSALELFRSNLRFKIWSIPGKTLPQFA